MTSQVIPLYFVLLYLESVERKEKNYKFQDIENEKSFFDELKDTFFLWNKIKILEGLSIGGKAKTW